MPRWKFSSAVFLALAWVALQTDLLPEQVREAVFGWEAAPKGDRIANTGSIFAEANSAPFVASHYRSAAVEERRIVDRIEVTGAVRPVALVNISSELSGQIKEFRADFNHEVRRGDLLALIDPRLFEIAVEQAEAQVGVAKSDVLKADVALRDTQEEFERKKALAARGTGSQVDLSKAKAARDLAEAQRQDAGYALASAEAGLKKAKSDLDRTEIRSPVDGTVIHRNIEVGQTVTVGLDAPVLYTLAQDLREMQVNVSVPEAEIGRIHQGQRMEFTVDAYPGRLFAGEVLQIRMQPQTTQNVVTYTVIATAPNPDLSLLPGMTATARIIVDETGTTLAVPTAALRFRLPNEPRGGENRILVARDGQVAAIPVKLGASDGGFTAVVAEGLNAGDVVITGLAGGASQSGSQDGRRLIGMF
jgi:HlyD family secretion protein